MININSLIKQFSQHFENYQHLTPWDITIDLSRIIHEVSLTLHKDYDTKNGISIHKTATIENNVVIKAPAIIGANCFIGSNAYLRAGVYLAESVSIGTGCEIKTSIVLNNSAIAHFNFIGDSIIGSYVNFEAGSITANHFNEKTNKKITVYYEGQSIETNVEKFGAIVGDDSKIGANAVLSPGTILQPASIVKRLELIDQQNDIANA